MNVISIIMCIVGIVGCVIGVATFVSAQMAKSRQDGALMAKVDYLVSGFDEQKKNNESRRQTLEEHGKELASLEARVKNLEKEVFK